MIFFANILYISLFFFVKKSCRLLLPTLPPFSFYFTTTLPPGYSGGCGVEYLYTSHQFHLPLLHVSLSWVCLIYITYHLWNRKGRERGVCGCACTHTLCLWSCAILYATTPLYLHFHHIFSLGGEGGRISHSFFQNTPSLLHSLSIIINFLSVCHCFLYMSMSLSLLFCMLLCDLLLSPRGGQG